MIACQWLTTQSEEIRHDPVLVQMVSMMEKRNVGVLLARLATPGNGTADTSPDHPLITLDDRMTVARRRFVLGHEIGHITLHQGMGMLAAKNDNLLNTIEREANIFSRWLIRTLKERDKSMKNPQCG